MLLPTRCPICHAIGPAPCAGCIAGLRRAPPAASPAGLASCRSLLRYDGPGRTLVTRFKYGNARDALPWLAAALAGLVDARRIDAVTWVPTTAARRRERGFDQAELLAARVAAELGRPPAVLLGRRPGPAQTGRTRAERLRQPCFVVRGEQVPDRLLLVDDVVTTGATLGAAARTLRGAGAGECHGLTVARTPPGNQAPDRPSGPILATERPEVAEFRPDPFESSTMTPPDQPQEATRWTSP
jgi:predicted amidophosphoribosyltransferase